MKGAILLSEYKPEIVQHQSKLLLEISWCSVESRMSIPSNQLRTPVDLTGVLTN
jgi:hypothetical protein